MQVKIFIMAVLILNFDLDLSKVNSDIWQMLNIRGKFHKN